jgi:hypothetical protein
MPRQSSPESLEAYGAVDIAHMQAIVLEYAEQCGTHGCTSDEACAGLGLGPNSVAPRLVDLELRGSVVRMVDASGRRICRMTRQGRAAAVYVVTPPATPSLPSTSALPPAATSDRLFPDDAPPGSWMSTQQLLLPALELPPSENAPDLRHHPIREFIKAVQREGGTPQQWDARSARALAKWLKANPTVTVDDAQRFVRNRFGSDTSRGEPPWLWLPKLTMYCEGPLDRFNRPCLRDWRAGYEGMR